MPDTQPAVVTKPPLPEELKPFLKSIKMGLPEVAIMNQMKVKGVDPKRLEEIKAWLASKNGFTFSLV